MRDLNAAIRNKTLDKHSRSSDSAKRAAFFPKGPGACSGNVCCTTAFTLSFQGRSRAAVFCIHLIQPDKLSMRNDSYGDITGYFPVVPLFWASVTLSMCQSELANRTSLSDFFRILNSGMKIFTVSQTPRSKWCSLITDRAKGDRERLAPGQRTFT